MTPESQSRALPLAARPALAIIARLRANGHEALLAGGCVRDWLLGRSPDDYDVATDAPPPRVNKLFRGSRLVGAHFGVVLVRSESVWVEVATFRADGPYLDGRRPSDVTFSDAKNDALRRDFTINGMFLDPDSGDVIDYVNGQADLQAGLVRAIGDPRKRFAEDYLRLIRAPRFAARLDFAIEPATFAAIREFAQKLAGVAAERIRDELDRMLSAPTRARAVELLKECGLLEHLWPSTAWSDGDLRQAREWLASLPDDAGFPLAFAAMNARRSLTELDAVARALAFSNEQRRRTLWLVRHQADLDRPEALSLAELKRLLANESFADLRRLLEARLRTGEPLPDPPPDPQSRRDAEEIIATLERRIATIAPENIAPPPFVSGEDLLSRGVPAGPLYKRLLDGLYTRQLDEELRDRDAALLALDVALREATNPERKSDPRG